MTFEEFKILGKYAVSLWPSWQPTPEQSEVWWKSFSHKSSNVCVQALDKAFAQTKWREPNLPDVLEQIRLICPAAPAPTAQIDEEKARAIIAQDLAMKRAAAQLPAPEPRPRERLSAEADALLANIREARQELAENQAGIDSIHAAADKQQKFVDECRKQVAELERQCSALTLELKAMAITEVTES